MRRALLAVGVAGLCAAPAAATAATRPVDVVRTLVRAVNHRDGVAICRLLTPQLQHSLVDGSGFTCARWVVTRVADSPNDPREFGWVRVTRYDRPATEPRTGVAAVPLRTEEHYVCRHRSRRCHTRIIRQRDVVYLLGDRFVKGGALLDDSQLDQPAEQATDDYPPGTATTVRVPVPLPGRFASCHGGAIASGPGAFAVSEGDQDPPWLAIRSFTVQRGPGHTICAQVELGGPPQPDSEYTLAVGALREHATEDGAAVDFDGLGGVHRMSGLRSVARVGAELQLVASAPPSGKFLVTVSGRSLQSDDPLLNNPIDAEASAPAQGCLAFPSGRVDHSGVCGQS